MTATASGDDAADRLPRSKPENDCRIREPVARRQPGTADGDHASGQPGEPAVVPDRCRSRTGPQGRGGTVAVRLAWRSSELRADLADVRPLLDVAKWTSTYHCNRQLAVLALTEAEESRIREADARRQDRMMLVLTVAAVWFGFTQTWEGGGSGPSRRVLVGPGGGPWERLMFVPSLVAGLVIWLLVRGGWRLAHRKRNDAVAQIGRSI